jgi:hypothetical protein
MLFSVIPHRSEALAEHGRFYRALLVGTEPKLAFRRRKVVCASAHKLVHVTLVSSECLLIREDGLVHKLLVARKRSYQVEEAGFAVRALHSVTENPCYALRSVWVQRGHTLAEQRLSPDGIETPRTRGVRRGRATPGGHLWVAAAIASIWLNETLPEISKFSPLLAHSLMCRGLPSPAYALQT